MAQAALISADEYRSTSYRPDCDFVDGLVLERNLGELEHANLQAILVDVLRERRTEWGIIVLPEQRVQVSHTRFRVPDVCIIRRSDAERILRKPPLVCIEVLSPDDTLHKLPERVDDYLEMGVENVWVLDPIDRRAYVAGSRGFIEPEAPMLLAAGTDVSLDLNVVFGLMDES